MAAVKQSVDDERNTQIRDLAGLLLIALLENATATANGGSLTLTFSLARIRNGNKNSQQFGPCFLTQTRLGDYIMYDESINFQGEYSMTSQEQVVARALDEEHEKTLSEVEEAIVAAVNRAREVLEDDEDLKFIEEQFRIWQRQKREFVLRSIALDILSFKKDEELRLFVACWRLAQAGQRAEGLSKFRYGPEGKTWT